MKPNSIPTIFEETPIEIFANEIELDTCNNGTYAEKNFCDDCELKNTIISELKEEIHKLKAERQCNECIWKEVSISELKELNLKVKIDHDIDIQKKNFQIQQMNIEMTELRNELIGKTNDDKVGV